MYYNECTKSYALEVIKEIGEYAENASAALTYIEAFLDNEMTVEEIENIIL